MPVLPVVPVVPVVPVEPVEPEVWAEAAEAAEPSLCAAATGEDDPAPSVSPPPPQAVSDRAASESAEAANRRVRSVRADMGSPWVREVDRGRREAVARPVAGSAVFG
ncbi:hypothetical protein GCM10023336_67860 [Streptomyces similanensis]|uniref:Uncharacterized protein n=1 Tax=Streptomyces similanensis TaxID=1274988 RepID=A0ABP9LJC8_9ACTN